MKNRRQYYDARDLTDEQKRELLEFLNAYKQRIDKFKIDPDTGVIKCRDRHGRVYSINETTVRLFRNRKMHAFRGESDSKTELDRAISENRMFLLIMFDLLNSIDLEKKLFAKSIVRPPGWLLNRFADFVYSKKTVTEVVNPILSDMQVEYCDALAENRIWKARWVRIRGYWSFWKAMALFNILRAVADIWRKVSSV